MTSILSIALLLSGSVFVISGMSRFWEREYVGNTFYFHYENFVGFVSNTWEGYQSQTETVILSNGMTLVTVTENSYLDPLALDVVFNSTASGMELTALGRYVELYIVESQHIINGGSDYFAIPTDGTPVSLDLSEMLWVDCGASGIIGGALEITFTVQTGGITETSSGDYTYDVSIGIGAE